MDGDFLSLALVFVLLALSAFFSSSESAFLSVQRTRIAHLVSEGVPGARRVANMIGEPERLLATILLGNNIVNAATTAVITATVVAFVGADSQTGGVTPAGVVIATAISTIALVLFGEIIPKTIAVRNSEKVAFLYSRPLTWTEYLLLPLVLILQWATRGLNALLGSGIEERRSITEDEFRSLIDIGEAEGEFEPSEAEMLENVFQFGDRQVKGGYDAQKRDGHYPAGQRSARIPGYVLADPAYPLPRLSQLPGQYCRHNLLQGRTETHGPDGPWL